MSDTQNYSYETRLNVQYRPLEVIDEKAVSDACADDEFFYVVEGRLLIDIEERTVDLGLRQGFVVPKGILHRTRAPERTVILMVENAGIVPTGS